MSLNDFMTSSKQKEPDFQLPSATGEPSSNDFNTMQLMFQTGSQGYSQPFSMGQAPSPFESSGPAANENDFSTMQNLFKTTNNANQSSFVLPSQPSEPKAPASGMFTNNKPGAFATMSGGAPSGFDFNMSSFGTMQVNPGKNPQAELNFFDAKPAASSNTAGGDLI
jgi:hypothetical protein